jgi:DNA-binding SARP family transcriptional activator
MARLAVRALGAGIEVAYVRDLVGRRRLTPDEPPVEVEGWPWALRVHTLGRFALVRDETPVRPAGKVQKMPMALLQALVALGGREVAQARLVEALWPDAEGDAGHRALATTLHRLRQLVGHDGAIVLRGGHVSLDPRVVWVDAWAFERLAAQAEAAERRGDRPSAAWRMEEALALYRGPFLAGDAGVPWAVPLRERLRRRFLRQVALLGRHWAHAGEWTRAVECYEKGLEVDDLAEEFHQGLMTGYRKLGRRAEALAAYRRCRETFAATLGIAPSPETEALHRALRAEPERMRPN